MAIVTHPDGYLQITEGHPWQDISDNGILQRIFRGWNERRLVTGLPLYWYGKNPNASELLGGDAQFTEFENPLLVPNPISTLEDARIYPGANLQNVAFWKTMQDSIRGLRRSRPFWYEPPPDNGYMGESTINEILQPTETKFPAYANFLNIRSEDDNVQQSDILGAWIINSMLKMLYEMKWARNFYIYTDKYLTKGIGYSGPSCESVLENAIRDWGNFNLASDSRYIFEISSSIGFFDDDGAQVLGDLTYPTNSLILKNPYTEYIKVKQWNVVLKTSRDTSETHQGYLYSPPPTRYPTEGYWTILQSVDEILEIDDNLIGALPYYGTGWPGTILGVDCQNPQGKSFHAIVEAYYTFKFADLP